MLRRLDPGLGLGFDFASHLDVPDDTLVRLPLRTNAYGYLDDHPLGYRRWMAPAAYLEDRAEVLLRLVSGVCEVYLRKEFVLRALADGFNPVQFVHERQPGTLVDVWTLHASAPHLDSVLHALLEAGIDQITTDTPAWLAERVGQTG
jgi:glycerophosphoryl diester phosphodiesterase